MIWCWHGSLGKLSSCGVPAVCEICVCVSWEYVIGVVTWFKNKKCFLGHVVHMTSQKHTCSETWCRETL